MTPAIHCLRTYPPPALRERVQPGYVKQTSCAISLKAEERTDIASTAANAQPGTGSERDSSGRLLNHHRWSEHRGLLQPFKFLLALLVGCALAGGDFVEGAPLRLHPHVGVARE